MDLLGPSPEIGDGGGGPPGELKQNIWIKKKEKGRRGCPFLVVMRRKETRDR